MFHLERVRLHAVPRHVHLDRVDARVPLSAGRDRTATRNGEAATVDPATRGSHLSTSGLDLRPQSTRWHSHKFGRIGSQKSRLVASPLPASPSPPPPPYPPPPSPSPAALALSAPGRKGDKKPRTRARKTGARIIHWIISVLYQPSHTIPLPSSSQPIHTHHFPHSLYTQSLTSPPRVLTTTLTRARPSRMQSIPAPTPYR